MGDVLAFARTKAPEKSDPARARRTRGVVVREGHRLFDASGQGLLDFAGGATHADVTPLVPRARRQTVDVEGLFDRAAELEEIDPAEGRRAYEAILARDPDHFDTHVNLGRLLHDQGDLERAQTHYRRAIELRPADATAVYNLGVALEDQEKDAEAIEAYQRTLALDSTWADAHFNLARLHERRGDRAAVVRHLRAYRLLTQGR